MSTVQRNCEWCKGTFTARTADVNRGWAKFCSKSCKAMKQEKRTGQYAALCESNGEIHPRMADWEQREILHENALYESTSSHGQDGTGGW